VVVCFCGGVGGPDHKVQLRKVELGPSAGGLRVVQKGVTEGERIVVEGVQKITDGSPVVPRPAPVATAAAEASAAAGKN
jgi:multidrug efflux pump subunit AcrA (membrane-fusion protein)